MRLRQESRRKTYGAWRNGRGALSRRRFESNLLARVVGFAVLLFFTLLAFAYSMHAAALVGCTLVALQFTLRRWQKNHVNPDNHFNPVK
jgi:hypothetical protein